MRGEQRATSKGAVGEASGVLSPDCRLFLFTLGPNVNYEIRAAVLALIRGGIEVQLGGVFSLRNVRNGQRFLGQDLFKFSAPFNVAGIFTNR